MIKNANESRGEIHPLALGQLAIYQDIARDWPRYPDGRCVRCGKCDQSIYMRRDVNNVAYSYTKDEIESLVVAHIRQAHAEVIDSGIE
jgi:hypothetical protein